MPAAPTLTDVLWARATGDRDRVALDFEDRTFTFGEVKSRAEEWAAALAAAGAVRGTRIALMSANRPEFVFAVYGALQLRRVGGDVQPGVEGGGDPARRWRRCSRSRARRRGRVRGAGRRAALPACRPARPRTAGLRRTWSCHRRSRRRRGVGVQFRHDRPTEGSAPHAPDARPHGRALDHRARAHRPRSLPGGNSASAHSRVAQHRHRGGRRSAGPPASALRPRRVVARRSRKNA